MIAAFGADTPEERRLSVGIACALLNNLIVGVAVGMFLPLLPLRLDMMGETPGSIGFHAMASSAGVLVIAPFISGLIARHGAPAIVAGASIVSALPLFLMMAAPDYWVWFIARLAVGVGFAAHWVGTEAWLNQAAPNRLRSRILSIYVISLIGGLAMGTPVLTLLDIAGGAPFLMIAAALLAAILPILFAWRSSPSFQPSGHMASLRMLKIAPVLMAVGLLAGITDGSAFALLPLFAVKAGLMEDTAVLVMTAFLVGAVAAQIPIGMLADRISRRRMLLLLAGGGAGLAAVLLPAMDGGLGTWIVSGLFGACVIGLYAVALGVIGERFRGGDMAAANAVFVLCFEFGALSGAPLSGAVMDGLGPVGLPIVMGGASALVLLGVLVRGGGWKREHGPG